MMPVGAPQDARGAVRGVDTSSPYAPAHLYTLRGRYLGFSERLAQCVLFPRRGRQEQCLL